MKISLPTRIDLCILSGIGVGLVQINDTAFTDFGGGLIVYGLSGLLFAAGVLFPYLKRDSTVFVRALNLTVASVASYWSAVWVALDSPIAGEPEWMAFTIASIVGAAIAMAAAVLMTPIRASVTFVILGLLAGVAGGPITYFTLPEADILAILGHAIWHTLICLAIYFGTPSTDAGARLVEAWKRGRTGSI